MKILFTGTTDMDAQFDDRRSGILRKLFHERLKETTADAHQALEDASISRALVSSDLNLSTYKTYLKLMLDVNWDAEANIFPLVTDIIPDLDKRAKSKAIITDLEMLGESDIVPSVRPFTADGKIITKPLALGILYVTEGATLGGRYILKTFRTHFG
jgi:heme oxygenase